MDSNQTLRMKKSLLLFLLLMNMLSLNAQQAYLGDALWNTLKKQPNSKSTHRVIVLLQDQVDMNFFNDQVKMESMSLPQRQQLLIRQLQQKANSSQKQLTDFIQQYQYDRSRNLPEIKHFWIVNMIVLDASNDLIWQLAQRSDIAWMDLDEAYITGPVKPFSSQPAESKTAGASEKGLQVIKANELWKMGYTGKNRISYSIDTGVWPNHPALRDRFLANFYPLSQCWFPYDSEFPADKTGSHGTHTLGTTLGLEAATNDTIGVAFNAYWICSDPVATSMATVKPLSDFMYAYEWAMNPDGDTNTFWDVPDVINNSWGYGIATDTTLCNSYVSQLFTAVAAAGIANVFSAGNEGPGDTTIGIPHEINTTLTNSFTVGALDGNTATYPIASFSSRGPSVCGGSGSILIKPEVSAPGVGVRSSVNSSGYDIFSGTSMAAPHVTGAVLLLKEAFPFLSGDDILYALYVTATDLGVPGEDNTYGMGLIDVLAAYNYLAGLYTPVPPDSSGCDAYISDIVNPGNAFLCDTLLNPEVVIRNNGTTPITHGVFHYGVVGETETMYNWAGNLLSGQSANVLLPAISIPFTEYAEFQVWFKSDTALHEVVVINNHRIARFHSRPDELLPFVEDFEQGIDSVRWHINNPNNNMSWDTMQAGGLLYSTYSALMRFRGDVPNNQLDDLITPSLNLSGIDSAFLKFEVSYQNLHLSLTDSLRIYVSTDCGETFPSIIYRKGGTQLQTYDTVTIDFVPWRADQWRTETVDLSAFAGYSDVLIKFTGHNKRGNNLFIDNIKVYSDTEPLAITSMATKRWNLAPNPAKDELQLQGIAISESDIQLSIKNIAGNICWQSKKHFLPGTTETIDISGLSSGIYILSILTGNTYEHFRFVKIN